MCEQKKQPVTNNIENIPIPNYLTQEISEALIPSSYFLSLPSYCFSLPNRLLNSTGSYPAQSKGHLRPGCDKTVFSFSLNMFSYFCLAKTPGAPKTPSQNPHLPFRERKTNHFCLGSFVLPQILTFEKP